MRDELSAFLREPPIRRIAKLVVRALPFPPRTKSLWDAVERPSYLIGVLGAVYQAKHEGHKAVSVIEFGVAQGRGLLALQDYAAAVERQEGIRVHVYGFDSGRGLATMTGDYRDHPDYWRQGDFVMSEVELRRQLAPRTKLVLGDVATTAMTAAFDAPIGFAALDLDLYSSTASALRVLGRSDVERLRRVALYFDDTREFMNHRFAGELLAIDEFNRDSKAVKIDRWRGIASGRPFPEAPWLQGMYLAHDLAAISQVTLARPPRPL
jgi:hypothetical protein